MSSESIRGYRPGDAAPQRLATLANGNPAELQSKRIGRTVVRFLFKEGRPDSSKLPVIMAPGISGPPESLWNIASGLYDHDVVIFQAPDNGYPLLHPPSIPWYGDVYAKAAKEITGQDTFNVVGHSLGGFFVQSMAHSNIIHIDRMAILASLPVRAHTNVFDIIEISRAMLRGEMFAASRAIRDHDRSNIDAGKVYGGDFRDDPELIYQYLPLIRRKIDRKSHKNQLHAAQIGIIPLAGRNSRQREFFRTGPPALAVLGMDDPLIPFDYTMLQAYQQEYAVYPLNCGHLLTLTRTPQVTGVLNEFFNAEAAEISSNWRPKGNYATVA